MIIFAALTVLFVFTVFIVFVFTFSQHNEDASFCPPISLTFVIHSHFSKRNRLINWTIILCFRISFHFFLWFLISMFRFFYLAKKSVFTIDKFNQWTHLLFLIFFIIYFSLLFEFCYLAQKFVPEFSIIIIFGSKN